MNINLNVGYFDEPYRELLTAEQRDIIVFGSASSGKSFSVMAMSAIWALEGRSLLITRKVAATITDSTWAEVVNAIRTLGIAKYFEIVPYKRLIKSRVSSGSILFRGLDNAEKIKSIRSPGVYAIDTVICEEATEMSDGDLKQLRIRQRGTSPFPKRFIMLFNPIVKTHHIYTSYFEQLDWPDDGDRYDDGELLIIKTTYKDNTHLSPEDVQTLEGYRETSPYHYQVYCLGMWGVFGDLVFDRVQFVDELPPMQNFEWRAGIDSGFNDAQTFTLSKYDGHTIQVVDNVNMRQADLNVFSDRVKEVLKRHGLPENRLILADSSDPRTNQTLTQFGLNVKKAVKGKGSKLAGLMFMKSKKIIVPRYLKGFIDSINMYTWKKGKNGNATDETVHDGSDDIDGLRYSLELDLKSKGTMFGGN